MKKILLAAVACSLIIADASAQNLEKGIQYYNYERYQSAKSELQSLAATNPEANYYLGLSEIGLEDYNGAKATFSKDPTDFYSQAGLARIDFIQNNTAAANKLLNDIVDHARKKDWEKYQAAADAITYTKGGDIQTAIGWYQKAMEKEPQNALLFIGLGDAYFKLQSGGGNAMDNYQAAVKVGTENSLAYSRIGRLWYVAHNYTLALQSYNQAKEADTTNPLPYRDLANAYQRSGKYANALENDELYLQKSDKNVDDQIQYANILFLSQKYAEAASTVQSLVNNGHTEPSMYRLLGYSAYEMKSYDSALNDMNTFFKEEKDTSVFNSTDYLYYGKIYTALAAQDSEKSTVYADSAERFYLVAVKMDTALDKADIYKKIADGYKDVKMYGKTGEWYGKIVAADSNAPAINYFYWGYWNFFGQNLTESEKAFKAMIKKYPKEGSALYWLARVDAAKDSTAKMGLAVQPYKDWLNFKADGYKRDNQQLMYAYQYLAYYYYNKNQADESLSWANKILEQDPNNTFAKQLIDYFNAQKKAAAAKKTTTATSKK